MRFKHLKQTVSVIKVTSQEAANTLESKPDAMLCRISATYENYKSPQLQAGKAGTVLVPLVNTRQRWLKEEKV